MASDGMPALADATFVSVESCMHVAKAVKEARVVNTTCICLSALSAKDSLHS